MSSADVGKIQSAVEKVTSPGEGHGMVTIKGRIGKCSVEGFDGLRIARSHGTIGRVDCPRVAAP